MKRLFTIFCILLVFLLLTGCSSKKQASNGPIPPGAKQQQQEESESDVSSEEFDNYFNSVIKSSNKSLAVFNDSVDGLYTGDVSTDQFKTIMKSLINDSNKLINDVEKHEIDPSFSDVRQNLVIQLNGIHQLFLDAIDMANNDEIDKDYLRTTYLENKQLQGDLVNSWLINGE